MIKNARCKNCTNIEKDFEDVVMENNPMADANIKEKVITPKRISVPSNEVITFERKVRTVG